MLVSSIAAQSQVSTQLQWSYIHHFVRLRVGLSSIEVKSSWQLSQECQSHYNSIILTAIYGYEHMQCQIEHKLSCWKFWYWDFNLLLYCPIVAVLYEPLSKYSSTCRHLLCGCQQPWQDQQILHHVFIIVWMYNVSFFCSSFSDVTQNNRTFMNGFSVHSSVRGSPSWWEDNELC